MCDTENSYDVLKYLCSSISLHNYGKDI